MAQHAAASVRSQRHQRHESRRQRRAELLVLAAGGSNYDPNSAWAIGRGESYADPNYSGSGGEPGVVRHFGEQIGPVFYKRTVDTSRVTWIARMKTA